MLTGDCEYERVFTGSMGNFECSSSRGSIVASLKLKRIDGNSPPGVDFAA